MVNAIAHRDIKPPRLTKQGFVARGAAAITVAGRFALAIRLRFHKYAPQQRPSGLALGQQAADELGGYPLGRASEEGLGEVLEGLGGYGGGFVWKWRVLLTGQGRWAISRRLKYGSSNVRRATQGFPGSRQG